MGCDSSGRIQDLPEDNTKASPEKTYQPLSVESTTPSPEKTLKISRPTYTPWVKTTLQEFQNYLYALYACNKGFLFNDIYTDIDNLHLRNVVTKLLEIYKERNDPNHVTLLEETLIG